MITSTQLGLVAVLSGLSAAPLVAADVSGRIDVRPTAAGTTSTAVVYAEPLDRPAPLRPITAKLEQKGKTFIPAVMVLPAGSTVSFPNEDPIFHNVFSLSSPAPFDLGLYRAGDTKQRTFPQAGAYRVFCNIHPQMTAFIVIAPTPYVAVADKTGRYQLDLPAGRYRVTARSDRSAVVTAEVTVAATATTVPDMVLDETRFVAVPHKNKFGQDYPASAYDNR